MASPTPVCSAAARRLGRGSTVPAVADANNALNSTIRDMNRAGFPPAEAGGPRPLRAGRRGTRRRGGGRGEALQEPDEEAGEEGGEGGEARGRRRARAARAGGRQGTPRCARLAAPSASAVSALSPRKPYIRFSSAAYDGGGPGRPSPRHVRGPSPHPVAAAGEPPAGPPLRPRRMKIQQQKYV